MRFVSGFKMFLHGATVLRSPTYWESLKARWGSSVDLHTQEESISKDVLSLVDHLREVLAEVHVTNATWLSIDDEVLFHDTQNNPDDVDALVEAVRTHANRFANQFHVVRAVFEKDLTGLELIIQATVPATFRKDQPALILEACGRLKGLRRADNESGQQARARLEKTLENPEYLQGLWASFEDFLSSVHFGLKKIFSDGKIEEQRVRVVATMPPAGHLEQLAAQSLVESKKTARSEPVFDADELDIWSHYYEDLAYTWVDLNALDVLLFDSKRAGANTWLEERVEIFDVNGAPLCERGWAGQYADTLRAVHEAAQHDFGEPNPRLPELRNYPRGLQHPNVQHEHFNAVGKSCVISMAIFLYRFFERTIPAFVQLVRIVNILRLTWSAKHGDRGTKSWSSPGQKSSWLTTTPKTGRWRKPLSKTRALM